MNSLIKFVSIIILLLFVANISFENSYASSGSGSGSGLAITFVPHQSNYTHQPPPFPVDPEVSGKLFGQKCDPFAKTGCNSGLECAEEKVVGVAPDQKYLKWSDAPKLCHFLRACMNGDKSPKQACFAACDTNVENCPSKCGNKSDKCTYKTACFMSWFVPHPEQYPDIVQPCTDHQECSSGYCWELKGKEGNSGTVGKVCMPYSKCSYPCKSAGEKLANQNQVCCMGLKADSSKTCINPNLVAPDMPDSLQIQMDPKNCQTKLYEIKDGARVKDSFGQDDETIVARKFWSFERYFLGLEWAWANADNPGRDDFFGTNGKAVAFGKKLREERLKIENEQAQTLKRIEELENEMLNERNNLNGASDAAITRMANSSSGIHFIRLLSENHTMLAKIDAAKLDMYTNSLDPLLELLIKQKNPEALDPKKHEYDKYGSHQYIVYCELWFPHCWFSKNICGTYFQKNKVCVQEQWGATGLGGGEHLVDPIYPSALISSPATAQYTPRQLIKMMMYASFNKMGEWGWIPSAVAGTGTTSGEDAAIVAAASAAGFAVAGPMGAVVAGVVTAIVQLFAGDWEIPYNYDTFKNKRSLLVKSVNKHFAPYAEGILPGRNADEEKYNQEKKVHNINNFITKEELMMEIMAGTPQATRGEDIRKAVQASVDQVPLETRRLWAIDYISAAAADHIGTYSATSDKEYRNDRPYYTEKFLIPMNNYLTQYHGMAEGMHNGIAACLSALADRLEQNYSGPNFNIGESGATPPKAGNVDPNIAVPGLDDTGNTCADDDSSCQAKGEDFKMKDFTLDMKGFDIKANSSGQLVGQVKQGTSGNGNTSKGDVAGGSLASSSLNAMNSKVKKLRDDILKKNGGKSKNSKETDTDSALSRLNKIYASQPLIDKFNALNGGKGLLDLANISGPTDPSLNGANSGKGSGKGDGKNTGTAVHADGGEHGNNDGSNNGMITFGGDGNSNGYGAGNSLDNGNDGSAGHQGEILDAIKRNEKLYRGNESDSLFNKITKAYIKYGYPKLLKPKKKK